MAGMSGREQSQGNPGRPIQKGQKVKDEKESAIWT